MAVVIKEIVVCANVRIECFTSSVTIGGDLLSSGFTFEFPLSLIANSAAMVLFVIFICVVFTFNFLGKMTHHCTKFSGHWKVSLKTQVFRVFPLNKQTN